MEETTRPLSPEGEAAGPSWLSAPAVEAPPAPVTPPTPAAPAKPAPSFMGNANDLVALIAAVSGAAIFGSCFASLAAWCVPLVLGIIGLVLAKEALDPKRARILSAVGIVSMVVLFLLCIVLFVLYVVFIAWIMKTNPPLTSY
jgi:CHASE2 domain-containing sensor protein